MHHEVLLLVALFVFALDFRLLNFFLIKFWEALFFQVTVCLAALPAICASADMNAIAMQF